MAGYILTEDDARAIRELQRKVLALVQSTRNRPGIVENVDYSPDLYICKAPYGGIPSITPANTGTSTDSADEPGYAYCDIWRINPSGNQGTSDLVDYELEQVEGSSQLVFNLSSDSVPSGAWVIVAREKWGTWLVVWTPLSEVSFVRVTAFLCDSDIPAGTTTIDVTSLTGAYSSSDPELMMGIFPGAYFEMTDVNGQDHSYVVVHTVGDSSFTCSSTGSSDIDGPVTFTGLPTLNNTYSTDSSAKFYPGIVCEYSHSGTPSYGYNFRDAATCLIRKMNRDEDYVALSVSGQIPVRYGAKKLGPERVYDPTLSGAPSTSIDVYAPFHSEPDMESRYVLNSGSDYYVTQRGMINGDRQVLLGTKAFVDAICIGNGEIDDDLGQYASEVIDQTDGTPAHPLYATRVKFSMSGGQLPGGSLGGYPYVEISLWTSGADYTGAPDGPPGGPEGRIAGSFTYTTPFEGYSATGTSVMLSNLPAGFLISKPRGYSPDFELGDSPSSYTPSDLNCGARYGVNDWDGIYWGSTLYQASGVYFRGGLYISGEPGTVTSLSGSGGTSGLTLTGGPITSAGTLTIGGTLTTENGGTGTDLSLLTGYTKWVSGVAATIIKVNWPASNATPGSSDDDTQGYSLGSLWYAAPR